MEKSVDAVYEEFKNRRAGMVKALTSDVEIFYRECDPAKDNLCLYGFEDRSWKVELPAEEVPPEIPEPSLGINFARDGMARKDWLSLVAVHSDAWLMSVAMYQGACMNKQSRLQLFSMMNEHPTLFEIVSGRAREKEEKEKNNNINSNPKRKKEKESKEKESKSSVKRAPPKKEEQRPKKEEQRPKKEEEEYEEEEEEEEGDEEEHGNTFCGSCAQPYNNSAFWICCDICQNWYHGSCVKMTAAKADSIEEYRCPSCAGKKARR